MKFQLIPPHDHHCNIVKKAIQIFKDHFIAILCRTDKSFPLNLWGHLLTQAEHTLKMLRTSHTTPTISAYTHLWGQHNYNSNPFSPLGCKVEAHLFPTIRETWAPHTASEFYHGIWWDHYRCHTVYINDTKHTRTCSTIFFKHTYLTTPTITPSDGLIHAANTLTQEIQGVIPQPTITTKAINQLMNIFI